MVSFFDLISFFGVASFFAWLTFAPLQSDQLQRFKGKNRKKAGDNFSTINDYLLVSFLAFGLGAACDYLYHYPSYESYRSLLHIGIGVGFFAGIVGLLWAMLYIRLIVKGEKTWYDINPPGFFYTFVFSLVTVLEMNLSAILINAQTLSLHKVSPTIATDILSIVKFAWFGAIFVTALGGWRVIRYSERFHLEFKELSEWKVGIAIRGLVFLAVPTLLIMLVAIIQYLL